ncbi:oxidoreductase [Paenarthrobacter ureafaciens]|uniref:hydroxyacid dehydrogenase n=1 Tax=Paenarthrobacter TaxID=1742992 RepID=UPI0015BDDF02|nr:MULTISPECIES: hydroxyacid dehydrogenase [Paenarthrobacter]NWL29287.1 oxidoreductase [Paenarthrobacter ureafaciens]QSZ54018.1 oxidoreductase [Paenarthrobacter ureafaciens]WOC62806.1 hydroxyacid dehydrogenase [Paenarthrobacter sp. AT5]BCW84037.1 hydroxyacid dehydrogenase [Arthrobacter sp. NicSoilE8]
MASPNNTQKLVALGSVEPDLVQPLLAENQQLVLNPTDEDLATAEAAIVRAAYRVDRDLLDRMPALKVIARTGVGTDLVDVAEADRRGIPVVITPGSNTASVAEGVFAHLLALVKRLAPLTDLVREGRWDERSGADVGDLEGFTLGIIGYGRIGRRVARIAEAFDLKVLAYDPYAEIPEANRCATVEELLHNSDFVTLHAPLTAENRNLINTERLETMRRGAVIINCSRGGLIDLDAAYAALQSGQLSGLGLDVFDPEPPAHHPIFDHANVTLTPHLMGFTKQGMAHTVRDAAQGAVDVLAGRAPMAVAQP